MRLRRLPILTSRLTGGDAFTNVAPKLGIRFATDPDGSLYASLSRGFRAPQMTELYRLQSGQEVADLDSEELDNAELGYRRSSERLSWQLCPFSPCGSETASIATLKAST